MQDFLSGGIMATTRQLHARIPADLFRRIKAAAELEGIKRDQFITESLEEATKALKPVQEEMQRQRLLRKKPNQGKKP